jgi:acyl-coenzyme A thioesterase PaaI-like protein
MRIRETCGLEDPTQVGEDVVADMTVRAGMLDDGYATAGTLAILFDWVLGLAIVTDSPGMIMTTTHLHIEMLRPALRNPSLLRGRANAHHLRHNVALGQGVITDADGIESARATIGALLLEPTPNRSPGRQRDIAEPGPTSTDLGIGGVVVDKNGSGVVLQFHPGPSVANVSGGVHGGVGVLMAHRALDAAVKAVAPVSHRLLELRAAFVRPIPATGELIEGAADVLHSGRRLTLVRGELRDHTGRAAVIVDATYMIGLTEDADP